MPAWVVSMMFTIGASTWFYTKIQHRNGNNTRQSAIVTAVVGTALFLVSFSIISMIT